MNRLTLIITGIILAGCTEISYKEPQPSGVKSLAKVPTNLHGTYLIDNDTIKISGKGFIAIENDETEFFPLSDSIVLKKYKGYFFVSYREGNVWLLRIMKRDKNGDLALLMMDNVPEDDLKKKEFIEKLSKETQVIQSEPHYIIQPTAKKLYDLIQLGYFKEKENAKLKKIN